TRRNRLGSASNSLLARIGPEFKCALRSVSRLSRGRGGPMRRALGFLAFTVFAGCSLGPAGALAGRVTSVEGGWLLEMYTVGAHVHIEDDAGVTLGVGRRMYL